MSTNTTTTCIELQPETTAVEIQEQRSLVTSNVHPVCPTPKQEITASKREYSIVGDAYYPSTFSGPTPTWLSDLIEARVDAAVQSGLTDYNLLVQDVRNAIDSIDVAKNTYVEQVSFQETVDGIVGAHLDTLNATYEDKFATITNLDLVESNAEFARATQANDLRAAYEGYTDARITSVQQAYADADSALADDITALDARIDDQEAGLSATASAVTGLQTYVGIDNSTSNPNGTGMLARIGLLEKQSDGLINFLAGTYEVMAGIEDDNSYTTNDDLITDALPYVSWTNMSGSGAPSGSTRPFYDYGAETPGPSTTPVLEGTLYVRSDFTHPDADKYYQFLADAWVSITEAQFNAENTRLKAAHVGDVYVQYSNSVNGVRVYEKSFKFIKTAVDATSPYSTDTDGYTWALVTDTDAQAAYAIALEARDLADSKRRIFVNLGEATPPPPYDIGDLWILDTDRVIDSTSHLAGDILRSIENKGATASYEENDWVVASSYATALNAQQTEFNDWVAGTYDVFVDAITAQTDSKASSFYQEAMPHPEGVGEPSYDEWVGDLWKKPSTNQEYIYQLVDHDQDAQTPNEYSWVETDVPDIVYDTIDGQKNIYVGDDTPTGSAISPIALDDMWLTGANPTDSQYEANSMYVCTAEATTDPVAPAVWTIPVKYTDDSSLDDFIDNTYNTDLTTLRNQTDGKIEYYFYDTYSDISEATDEDSALALIASAWDTSELREEHHGNVVYFKTTENGYWYSSFVNSWRAITDVSIYRALQEASNAKGAADGKVSQFYAWGGVDAPADYEVVLSPEVRDPEDNSIVQEEVKETVSAANFLYWFKTNNLYYNTGTVAAPSWTLAPSIPDNGTVYISEGDLVTVFDPIDGDISTYSYNGISWQSTGPQGIVSKSKWFVDLGNAVYSPDGHLATSVSGVEVTSKAYTDAEARKVENKFSYDSVITVDGEYYRTGFGLSTTGSAPNGSGTAGDPYDSEFWINAERLVLKSPSYPGVQATFKVEPTGIRLGLEHTEATKNEPKGEYNATTTYSRGDMVTYDGSSYIALKQVTGVTPSDDGTNWQLMASQGVQGIPGLNGADGVSGSDGVSIVWKGSFPSHPSDPQNGWAYKNTEDGISYVRQDGAWYQMSIDGVDGVNGVDGADGLDIVWKGDSSTPPSNPVKNWVYRDTDNGLVYIYNGSAWELMVADGSDGAEGARGPMGYSVYITYHSSPVTSVPGLPTGDGTSGGWTTTPSASSNWMSQKVSDDASSGSWGAPVRITGADGTDGTDGRDGFANLLRAADHWVVGTSGSQGVFSHNGATQYNNILSAVGPLGTSEPLWEASGTSNDTDGGWDASVPIDHTKTYRSCVWMKQGHRAMTMRFGCSQVTTLNLDGSSNGNPYFWTGDLPSLDKWYLVVGVIHGSGYTGGDTGIAGVYDPVSGDKVIDASEYKNKPSGTTQKQRTNRARATSSAKTYFARPRFEEVNGEEYSIQEILGRKSVDGTDGRDGTDGVRGTAILTYSNNLGSVTPSGALPSVPSYWNSAATSAYDTEIAGDTLIVTNTSTSAGWTHIYEYDGSSWGARAAFRIDGDAIVDGTVVSDALATDIIIGKDATFEGKVELVGSTHKRVSSATPFGTQNQFIEWFGLATIAEKDMSEGNAITYLKTDGSAYFGGALISGALSTSSTTSSLGASETVEIGPFGSNGGVIAINCSVSMNAHVHHGIGSGLSSIPNAPANPSCTLTLEEKVGSSWVPRQTANYTGTGYNGPFEWDQEFKTYTGSQYQSLTGSFTFTDAKQTTTDRTYRLRMTGRTGFNTGGNWSASQRVSINAQET